MPPRRIAETAAVFFALGDPTRLALVEKLGEGRALSIAQLTDGTPVTRQAVTKHLRVLEDAGLVTSLKRGREVVWLPDPTTVEDARAFLDRLSREWDVALARLKKLVEED